MIDGSVMEPVTVVRVLDVFFDTELSVQELVSRLMQTGFFQLRCQCSICRQLGLDVTVLSCLDCCNAVAAHPALILATLASFSTSNH